MPKASANNLNALAKLVSNAGFQRILLTGDVRQHGKHLKKLLIKTGAVIDQRSSYQNLIELSYNQLLKSYRHEYVYKTALLNSYVLKNHSLSDTILLNEFRIGGSKADAVLVNGTNKVFEIKTELDSPDRLSTQLTDYYKAFAEVFVVVHHSHLEKYLQLIDAKVGVLLFQDNQLETYRNATPDTSRLDTVTMMKALRKDEYLTVVKKLTGDVPAVSPVTLFKECLHRLGSFAPDEVQYEFLKVIKGRINPIVNELIVKTDIPDSVKLSCYHANIDQNGYISLMKNLSIQF